MLVVAVIDIKASDTSGFVAIISLAFLTSASCEDNKLYGVTTSFLLIIQLNEGPTRFICIAKCEE